MDLTYKLAEDKEVRYQEGSKGFYLFTGNVIKYLSLERKMY